MRSGFDSHYPLTRYMVREQEIRERVNEEFRFLVETGERLLQEKKFETIEANILTCYNNFRSGWTESAANFYRHPQTEADQQLVDRMSNVMEKTCGGILETAKPSKDFLEFIDIEFVALQLYRLGDKAPKEMIQKTRELLKESYKLGAPGSMALMGSADELLDELENK